MAGSAYVPGLTIQNPGVLDAPRHSMLVRVTHWIHTLSFFALVVSGIAILVAHPRFYWGETGGVGGPSLFDLPLPFIFGPSGWGRYLHFLAAWICVINAVAYGISGFRQRRFPQLSRTYEPAQRRVYLVVIFVLFPLVILTGFAMSPALTSVVPALVNIFGGQQSARTIHFFVACALVLFLVLHVVMVCVSGFTSRMSGMITGRKV
jgi:thiosulfate reductase cytochrome b subunit